MILMSAFQSRDWYDIFDGNLVGLNLDHGKLIMTSVCLGKEVKKYECGRSKR